MKQRGWACREWPEDGDPEYAVSLGKKVGMRGLLGSLSQPDDSASFLQLPTGLGEVPKFPLTVFPLLPSPLSPSTLLWEVRQGESQGNSGYKGAGKMPPFSEFSLQRDLV